MTRTPSCISTNDTALTTIEQAVAAFHAAPTWAGWEQLRRRHRRYIMTHMLCPGREVDVISSLWTAICEGPFLLLGWTRDSFVQAINALLAAGAVIPLVHPDHLGARLAGVAVAGDGECYVVDLADDAIGAIMLENDELVIWLYPVLAFHQAQARAALTTA